ncbi:hypothetical protein HMPREF1032_02637 [Subdoligranulum sp. 4_3_54A2FAA]|nr:hypothetical protein HMPREF1032_02637 [Subdoligranulum sp. 4_3_54A2FAA]
MNCQDLKRMANQLRYDTLQAFHTVGSGHPGGCLSLAEIITVLYFDKLRLDPQNPKWVDRDRFLLSKGHGAPILFAALAHRGYFDISNLNRLRQHDGMLQGTPNPGIPGCDTVAGSLGQNLSIAIGTAYAGRLDGKDYQTYCVMGDGEIDEGQVWEAMMLAPVLKLGNLFAILDHNHVQSSGTNDEVLSLGNIRAKAEAFGWNVIELDGHDVCALKACFDGIAREPVGTPTFIIADTVKGKGISYMEGKASWHVGGLNDEQWAQAQKELKEAGL